MKWLLNVVIRFLTRDDPKLIPLAARAGLAVATLASFVVIEVVVVRHLSLLDCLAKLSVVWAVFAVGIRTWTSIASNQDLKRFSNQIVKMGSSTKLSIWDSAAVIAFAHLSFVMSFLISAAAVLVAIHQPGQLKLPLWLALFFIWLAYFPAPAILAYLFNNVGRYVCSRWRARLQRDTSNAEIKRILNLNVAYTITVVGAVFVLLKSLF
jgi:hypothetical protein